MKLHLACVAAGAIQIGTIAATKFHSGGVIADSAKLSSDEVPIIAQTGEGVLSRRGMSALGGAGALNRLNNGQGVSGGGAVINIYIQEAKMTSSQNINDVAEQLGFAVNRSLRTARSI